MSNKNFKVKNGLDVGNNISISDTGTITGLDTDNLPEGTTNVYYTDTRADARVAIGIANLVDSAPTTLDTLNELAAALGDDPNFATTVTTALGNKLNTADFTSTADTWLGTKDTGDLSEGTNLYYTDVRARGAVSVTDTGGDGALSYNSGTGVITYTGPSAGEVRAHLSGGTGVTYTAGTGVIAIGQDVATSASPTFVTGTFTGNINTSGASSNRFTRTAAGTGNNAALILNRNRTDAARANANGPWLAFEYQGTDNTQATSPIAAVRSQYDTTGRNYLELLELSGSYTTGVQTIARFKRGDYFLRNSTGFNAFTLDDDNCSITGQVATAGFQNLLFLNKRRTDVTAPTNGDLADFRIAFQGNTGNAITVGKFEGEYDATNGHRFSMNVYDATGTTSIAAIESSQKETVIAGIPTAGGAPAAIATFNRDNIILGGTTGTTSGDKLIYSRQYISAYDSSDQPNPVANAENLMVFGTTDINNGISIVTNGTALTRITCANAGVYNIQFSAQLSQTSGGSENAYIWLKKNGTTVANTAGDTRVSGNGDLIMAAWNYVVSAAAGDYFELAWAGSSTSVILNAIAAAGVVPGIPSVILTVVPVGA